MRPILERMLSGLGRSSDPDNLLEITQNILGNTICPLGDAVALPVISFVKKFGEGFEYSVRTGRCDLRSEEVKLAQAG